jgi:MFS family permease
LALFRNLRRTLSAPFALLTPTLRWFLVAMILANIAGSMVFSLLAVYMAEVTGATIGQVGLVYTLGSFVPLALQVVGGWLSDNVGRLRMIAISSAIACLGYLIFPLAPTWPWVLAALCLEYVSGAVIGPAWGAFIAEQSSEAQRGRVFGLSQGLFMIVGVVGPWLSGLIAYRINFRFMYATAAVLYFSATALRIWMARDKRFRSPALEKSTETQSPQGEGENEPGGQLSLKSLGAAIWAILTLLISGGLVTWIFLTDGVRDVAFRLSGELQPLYMNQVGGLSVEQVGQVSAIFGLLMMLTTFPAGWLSDRIGERLTIIAGFIIQAAGFGILVNWNTFWGYGLANAVFGLGVGIMAPAYEALMSKAIPARLRGVGFGLLWTSLGIISLPAPWLGARLWELTTPQLPFIITGLVALVTVLPVWLKFKLPEKAVNSEP